MTDTRLRSDAALLQEVLEGRVAREDARARELFERRPEWRGLQAAWDDVEQTLGPETLESWTTEDDRRVVLEHLASAREIRGRSRPVEMRRRGPRRWRLVATLAALVAVALGAWAWLQREPAPDGPNTFLGSSGGLECAYPGAGTPDFDRFAWTWDQRLQPNSRFLLTVWAVDGDGGRGQKLLERETRNAEWPTDPEERGAWPDEIQWRVEVLGGGVSAHCESRSRRSR